MHDLRTKQSLLCGYADMRNAVSVADEAIACRALRCRSPSGVRVFGSDADLDHQRQVIRRLPRKLQAAAKSAFDRQRTVDEQAV